MQKIKLPISKDYVKSWTVNHALREIFQNAIDREAESMKYQWGHTYDNGLEKLSIYNRHTTLDLKTLLLGKTSKANNNKMIGQFGEGYKLALLVFCRLGYDVQIITGKYIWNPKIEFSEEFQEDILTIEIEENNQDFESLIFNINIPPDVFEEYKFQNLHLLEKFEKYEAYEGQILLDKSMSKRIYVNGLYICTLKEDFKYGYNFKPEMIDLDRDRNSVRPWEVCWQCKKLLAEYAKTKQAPIKTMILESRPDVDMIMDSLDKKTKKEIKTSIAEDFIIKHGEYAYPVSCEDEKKEVLEKYSGISTVITKSKIAEAIVESDIFQENIERWDALPSRDTPHQSIQKFVNEFESVFENKTVFTEAFEEQIFQKSKNWMWKE